MISLYLMRTLRSGLRLMHVRKCRNEWKQNSMKLKKTNFRELTEYATKDTRVKNQALFFVPRGKQVYLILIIHFYFVIIILWRFEIISDSSVVNDGKHVIIDLD